MVENLCVVIQLRRKPRPEVSEVPCLRPISQKVTFGTRGRGIWKPPQLEERQYCPLLKDCFSLSEISSWLDLLGLENTRPQAYTTLMLLAPRRRREFWQCLGKLSYSFLLCLSCFGKHFYRFTWVIKTANGTIKFIKNGICSWKNSRIRLIDSSLGMLLYKM